MQTKSKLSKFNNILFLEFSILCITFIWVNYYLRNFIKALSLSIIIIVIFSIIFFTIKAKKCNKNKEQQKQLDFNNYVKFQFRYGKSEYINNFVLNLLNITDYEKINTNHYYDKKTTQDIFFIINNTNFCEETFYNNSITNNITIISLDKYQIKTKLKNYMYSYYDYNKIFNICCTKNTFPITKLEKIEVKKYNIKEILEIMLNKSVSKKYFIIGLILMFYSIFSRFRIYYIIFATITLILSIYSRFNSKFNKKNS